MNIRTLDYVGILGYSEQHDPNKIHSIERLTRSISLHGFGICAGCISGPFYFAFRQAKIQKANTRLISNTGVSHFKRHLCDILEMVSDPLHKNELIARVCIGGIVISGGIGTSHLTECFLKAKKSVIAIPEYLGTTRLPKKVRFQPDLGSAFSCLLNNLESNSLDQQKTY